MTEKTKDNQEKLNGKLVESLSKKEYGELAKKYASISVFDIVDGGVLSDIPIINTIIGFAKTGRNFRDMLYVKKIVYFMNHYCDTTDEEREKFIKDNCQDVKKFEEAVLLILEQADNMEKSNLIGKIFKACILGKISYQDALTLSTMVNRAFWNDLKSMFDGIDSNEQRQRLYISGLYKIKEKRRILTTEDFVEFQKVDYAVALQKIHAELYEQVKLIKGK